ncbi:MAG: Pentapeptide repeat protein, partial [Leptospirillum sp. Group IV 'UBA BS']
MGKTREDLLSKIADLKGSFQGHPKNPAPRKIQPSVEELIGKDRIVSSLQSVRARVAASLPEGGPPSSEVSEKLAQMEASLESLPVLLDRMSAAIPRPSVEGIIRILHHFAPPDPDPARSSELRRTVQEELSRRGSFKNRNLRGADLSGLDLSGADFSDADLIGADFTGANLSDARCAGAWMAHADLSRCTLDRTNFSGASLGCANLSGSGGAGMSFRNAFLSGAILSDVLFSQGDFSGADLFHAVFRRSEIHRSSFVQTKFLRAGTLPFSRPEGLPPSEEAIPRFPIEET